MKPCLWFDGAAEKAAAFYVSIFPQSEVTYVQRSGIDWPGGRAGDVIVVEFALAGSPYQALNGGPSDDSFNTALSLSYSCVDQAEVDRIWDALLADGGEPIVCGWLKDKYGVNWQIVPQEFVAMMRSDEPDRVRRVMEAMNQMVKLDVAALRDAFDG